MPGQCPFVMQKRWTGGTGMYGWIIFVSRLFVAETKRSDKYVFVCFVVVVVIVFFVDEKLAVPPAIGSLSRPCRTSCRVDSMNIWAYEHLFLNSALWAKYCICLVFSDCNYSLSIWIYWFILHTICLSLTSFFIFFFFISNRKSRTVFLNSSNSCGSHVLTAKEQPGQLPLLAPRPRDQELCESRGGRPGLPVPNNYPVRSLWT